MRIVLLNIVNDAQGLVCSVVSHKPQVDNVLQIHGLRLIYVAKESGPPVLLRNQKRIFDDLRLLFSWALEYTGDLKMYGCPDEVGTAL